MAGGEQHKFPKQVILKPLNFKLPGLTFSPGTDFPLTYTVFNLKESKIYATYGTGILLFYSSLVFMKKKIERCMDANNLEFLYNPEYLILHRLFSQVGKVYNASKLTTFTI